jgi:probable HAF family extracellular repeat protein
VFRASVTLPAAAACALLPDNSVLAAVGANLQAPILLDLGTLPGGLAGNNGYASAISADGRVVVGTANYGTSGRVAFMWTAEKGMVSLDPAPRSRAWAEAAAVSRDGSVIVGWWNGRAFRWTRKGGLVSLGTLPGSDTSFAQAVSADGTVIVGVCTGGVRVSGVAFRWTQQTGMIALPGDAIHAVNATSADGKIAYGEEAEKSGHLHVVRWDSDGNITRFANGPEVLISEVHGVTADGSIAVGSQLTNSGLHAVAWFSSKDVRQLGAFHGGNSSEATAVNADGSVIVGTATDGANHNRTIVFRWTESTGMRSLTQWIREAGGDPGPVEANLGLGVSADGSRIVGGLRNTSPYIAVVP